MLKLIISLFCGTAIFVSGAQRPSFITPCSRSLPSDELSSCILAQGKNAKQYFAKGIPELDLEPADPLSLPDISAKAGTFTIKSTNIILKGLKKVDIREMKWNLQKNVAQTRLFGNFTFLSDYETDGRVLLIPITGNGKLAVKMYDTEVLIKYKIRKVMGEDGVEHLETYDLKPSQTYGLVKIHMSNILGGDVIGDTVNQVLNDNWRDLMEEVGPPFIKAVADKVHQLINQLYYKVPYDELFLP